jgi:hypothetical protein
MRRRAAACIAALAGVALLRADPAFALRCGNGIVDADEACDYMDLRSSAPWQCCTRACELASRDPGDTCDARSACDDVMHFTVWERRGARLRMGARGRAGDGTLRFTGISVLPPAGIAPDVTGVQISVRGRFADELVLHAAVPGGTGWRVGENIGAWRYRDPSGAAGGVTRVALKAIAGTPDRLAVAVEARHARLGLRSGEITGWKALRVTIALDPSTVGARPCLEAHFPVWDAASCKTVRRGRAARCAAPGPVPRCRADTPDRSVRCAVRRAAHGQALLYSAIGSYATTACAELPGFEQSPGVACSTAVGTRSFEAFAAHAEQTFTHGCKWYGPEAGRRHRLICE